MGRVKFYLGTHRPHWLWDERLVDVPLFLSHRQLRNRRRRFPLATTAYGVDSGAFTEMTTYGRWVTTPIEYVDALYRYREEIGPFDFAGQQDLMCEPFVLDRVAVETGRRPTVLEHQERTVENYLALHEIAPDLPIAPTLQGWEADDYLRAVDLFTNAGVDLTEARCVGVGSVCRRQDTAEIARVLTLLNEHGLRLHGYGVKAEGLRASAWLLVSSDSMAWSYAGRRSPDPNCQRKACNNCLHYALAWRKNVLLPALRKDTQMALAV